MTFMDKACYERGCLCYDAQDHNEYVDVVEKKEWVGLTWHDTPDEWVGKVAFMEGAKWAEKKLRKENYDNRN
jgi:hypothetical protein